MKARLLFLALFFVSSLALFAEKPKTIIKIVVKNQFDKPVENAAVILDFGGGGLKKAKHWEVHTNQEGLAHFPPVPEGTVQLQVHKKTYQTFGEKIDVSGPEHTVNIKLSPPQSQYSAHPPMPADAPKKQ